MKLIFVIKALNDAHGGAERVLADISSSLARKGHDLSIVSFDQPDGSSFYPLDPRVKRTCVSIGDSKEKITLIDFVKKIFTIRKIVRSENPDCVIGFMHSSFVPAAFGMIGLGVPLIASEHIVPEHYKNRKIEYLLFLLSLPFIDKITVLSRQVLENYSPVFHSKMHPITNPIHSRGERADTVGNSVEPKVILNVGRLEDQKDQRTLIEAFSKLAPDFPDWSLRIIGEGSLRASLERLVKKQGLEKRISLPGTTREIIKEYLSAHIFALPSKYESFGLATAEAMACGLPVIGFSECAGTNELILDNKNGLLIDEDGSRVDALAQGLKRLMNNPRLRKELGQMGQITIKKFDPDQIADAWEILILNSVN